MPTIYGMRLPEPANWQEFELITRDAMQLKWGSPTLQRNGRAGQEQHGVDIYGPDQLGRPVAIQCKNTVKALSFQTIKSEVEKAEYFDGKPQALYVATTAPMDAELQKEVRRLSEQRIAEGKFAVALLYWEDIFSGLVLDAKVLAAHYPNITIGGGATKGSSNADRLAGLVLGYYGGFLWRFTDLLFGEAGEMAQENPEQFRTLVRMLKVNSRILSEDDAADIQKWSGEIEKLIFNSTSLTDNDKKWRKIKELAQATEQRSKYLPSLSDNVDTAAFIEIGLAIGAVYHSNGDLTQERSARLHRMISALMPDSSAGLLELLTSLADKPTYTVGPALYTFVDRELRFPPQGVNA